MPAEPAASLRDLLDSPDPFPGLDAGPEAAIHVPIDVPDVPPEAPAAPEPTPPSTTPAPAARAMLTLDDLQLEPRPAQDWPTPDEPSPEEDLWAAPARAPAVASLAPPEFVVPEPAEAEQDAAAAAHGEPRRSDRRKVLALALLAVIAVLAVIGSGYLLLRRRASGAAPAATPAAATCERASGTVEVQRRTGGSWHPLAAGGGLGSGDVVRTGPASSARVAFATGGALELEADATVEIGVSAQATTGGSAAPENTVAVQAGVVRGVLPSASDSQLGLVIRGEDGSTTRLATAKGSAPAEVRLTRAPAGTEVAVTEGEVEVGSGSSGRRLGAGRAIDLPPSAGRPVVDLLDFPASVAPGVDARFQWRKGLGIRLAWKKVARAAGYRVQTSRTLSFETVSGTFETKGTEISFAPEADGLYAWRVASRDDAGRYGEYGFARRLYCDRSRSRDLLVGPADREAVTYTGPGTTVTFTWQSAADAKAYRLVVATSPKLQSRIRCEPGHEGAAARRQGARSRRLLLGCVRGRRPGREAHLPEAPHARDRACREGDLQGAEVVSRAPPRREPFRVGTLRDRRRSVKPFLSRFSPQAYALMRIVAGFLFLWHGTQKLFGFPPGMRIWSVDAAPTNVGLECSSGLELVPNAAELSLERAEGGHDVGVEVLPAALPDHPARLLVAERGSVAALRRQRVVEVGERDDACREGDGRATEAVGVAAAVPPLVVRPRHLDAHSQELVGRMAFEHLGERVGAERAVPLHLAELLRGQLSGLQQDGVGNADLPDVVERRRLEEVVDEGARQVLRVQSHLAHPLGQHPAEGLHPLDVLPGVVIAGLGELGEREDGRRAGTP